jgi:hypothetical protein
MGGEVRRYEVNLMNLMTCFILELLRLSLIERVEIEGSMWVGRRARFSGQHSCSEKHAPQQIFHRTHMLGFVTARSSW